MLMLVAALAGGWSWFWYFAAGKAQAAVEGWRAREAQAGRIYDCGKQSIGGFPFRFEMSCKAASAVFRGQEPTVEVKTASVLVAAQVYQPTLLISEIHGPLTIADLGRSPRIVANWSLGQSSVRGTPRSPERVSFVFEDPAVELIVDDRQQDLLRARRVEVHGRIVEGSAQDNPVVEMVLRLAQASAPAFHPAAVPPVDAEVTAVMRGLGDFSPQPWRERFRDLQRRGGRIDVVDARVRQGDTLAVGSGSLSLDPDGYLEGQVSVTVAGLEPFLIAIGAPQMVQRSQGMDKIAGMLDRLSPGLGEAARQQVAGNLGSSISMLGQPATLDGRKAVTLPLRFQKGLAYLGPIPLGPTPALF
jgi:hypothetical protein